MPVPLCPAFRPCTLLYSLFVGCVATALGTSMPAHGAGEAAVLSPRLDVSYVPTPDNVVARMLELAEVGPDDYLVDLGSGDGRIVIAAARDHDVQQALGVDIDPTRIEEARRNAEQAGVADRVRFEQENIFELDFADADVVTMYLLPNLNRRLRPTLLEPLAPGTRIVSHAFDMGEWTPDVHEQVERRDIYLWIVPAQVAGAWDFTLADGTRFEVLLRQEFQNVTGRATLPDRHVPLSSLRLEGSDIRFSIDDHRFVGRFDGDRLMAVETDRDEVLSGWSAIRRR